MQEGLASDGNRLSQQHTHEHLKIIRQRRTSTWCTRTLMELVFGASRAVGKKSSTHWLLPSGHETHNST